ncbi:PKD domain-containing protein, partial [Saprospiraceae bacterium]|nr:PKD domain-containing protein [Saprospiraceae bacterium]
NNAGLNTCNYDNTLQGWSTLDLTPNVNLGANGQNYCNSESERQSIIDNFSWTINGDELDCSDPCLPSAAPPNDTCADAEELFNVPVEGTTADATPPDFDFCDLGTTTSHVVYYSYTIASSTNVNLTITFFDGFTGASAFEIYEDCNGNIFNIDVDGDDPCNIPPNGTYTYACVEPGTELIIAVGSLDGSEGAFQIQVSEEEIDDPTSDFTFTVDAGVVTFTNQSSNADTYNWDFGDGNTSTESDPIHTYTSEGTYNVTLTATNDCGIATSTQSVIIDLVPVAVFGTVGLPTDCAEFVLEFIDQSTNNPTEWSWTFEGGNPATSTEQNPTVTYSTPGTFDVSLTVTDAVGMDTNNADDYVVVQGQATADFDYTVDALEVTFDNQSTGSGLTYLWDFGDGNTSTDSDPIHTYTEEGIYDVTLTTTGPCNSDITTQTVDLYTIPTADFSSNITEGCSDLTVVFNQLSSNNVTDYAWTFEGGNPTTSTDPNPVVIYTEVGTYNVELVVSNPAGSASTSEIDYITVIDVPTANFVAVNNILTVTFTNNSTGADSYLWDFGDGNTSTDSDPIHTYAAEGDYTVTLTATNECGDAILVDIVSVNSLPSANAFVIDPEICEGDEVQFTDASSDNVTDWLWTFEGGTPATSTEQNPFVTYNTVGIFDVSLVVTAPAGTDEIIFENLIIVSALPTSDFVAVNNILTVTFTNNSTNADSYLWDFGDGNTSTDSDPIHTYAAEDDYTVTLTATNECGDVSSTQSVSINSMPTANFVAGITEVCEGGEVQFTDASSDNVTGWLWTFEGGTPATSTEQNPLVTYNTPGTYDVTLEVTAGSGSDQVVYEDLITIIGVPTAEFEVSIDDLEYSFIYTGVDGDEFNWDFGDGNTSTEVNPVHTYNDYGIYTVILVVSNACGNDFITKQIDITSNIYE